MTAPVDPVQRARAREVLLGVVGKNRLTAFGEANAINAMLAFAAEQARCVSQAGKELRAALVAGPVWRETEEEAEVWTAEVQALSGYSVIATVHGGSHEQAEQRQLAIIAALARDAS